MSCRRSCRPHGWDLVRRPTGGRAILHTDELTYSVAGPQDEPRLAGSVLESYRVLAQALLYALQLLAIPAQAQEKPGTASTGSPNQNPVCFEVPSNYEITVGGKKLVGSAQARRKEGVLQHGSLPLYGDLTRIVQALLVSGRSLHGSGPLSACWSGPPPPSASWAIRWAGSRLPRLLPRPSQRH